MDNSPRISALYRELVGLSEEGCRARVIPLFLKVRDGVPLSEEDLFTIVAYAGLMESSYIVVLEYLALAGLLDAVIPPPTQVKTPAEVKTPARIIFEGDAE